MKMGGHWGKEEEQLEAKYETIASLDLSEADYSFNLLTVWRRRSNGMFLYATDAGCSCPSPYENTEEEDLKEFTWTAIDELIRDSRADKWNDGYPLATEEAAFKDLLKKAGA